MLFRVTILGSGTIIPSRGKKTTSLLIETGRRKIMLDCGPCSLQSAEDLGHPFRSIGSIFITHYHPDHSLGLAHLFSALKNDRGGHGGAGTVVYGPRGLNEHIDAWRGIYPSIMPQPAPAFHELDPGETVRLDDTVIRTAAAGHAGVDALSYRVEQCGRSVVYTGDTELNAALVDLSRGADLLFAECSFPEKMRSKGHMTPHDAGLLAEKAGVKDLVLVHIYPVFDGQDPASIVKRKYDIPVGTGWDSKVYTLCTG